MGGDSADSVVSAVAESMPPTPGESIRRSPPLRISRGSITSAATNWRSLPGFPSSETYCGSWSIGMARRSSVGVASSWPAGRIST